MEYKEIKRLMDDMGESKLNEISIKFPDGTEIKIKKDGGSKTEAQPVIQPAAETTIVNNVKTENKTQIKPDEEAKYVTSPMVGTFYSKPSPTEKPFVEVGTKVKKGDKLCIIEAMKLMNEIEAETDGEIVEILVKDEEIVEYGKKLFKIK